MPRRKSNQLKEAREKRETQIKLMQISLRIDDHIYKNNPISPEIAERFFQEVSALSLRCHQDRRLLQVIEKLTRIMKQIIVEKSEHDVSETGTADGFCATTESTEVMNLCLDNDIPVNENIVDPQNNDIAEISRAVSSISVHDIESQSILNNNEHSIDNENFSCGQGYEEYEKIATLPYEKNNTFMTSLDLQYEIEKRATNTEKIHNIFVPAQKENKYAANTSSANTTHYNLNNIEIPNKNNNKRDAVVNKRKLVKNDALNSNKDNIIKKSADVVGTKKSINIKAVTKKGKFKPPSKNNTNIKGEKKNKHLINGNTNDEMKTVSKDTKYSKDKVKTISQDMNETIISTQTNNFASKEKIESKKTTENVASEMDLSWVEAIKYVRQIDKEEYNHNMSITETFWNNCELPPDWNETEFNY